MRLKPQPMNRAEFEEFGKRLEHPAFGPEVPTVKLYADAEYHRERMEFWYLAVREVSVFGPHCPFCEHHLQSTKHAADCSWLLAQEGK